MYSFSEKQKNYFENVNVEDINDNKKFWKMVKPFFSNKGLNKLMLIEDNNLISEESGLANTMNQYFTSITKQLNLKKSSQLKNLEYINYYHIILALKKLSPQTTRCPNYLLLISFHLMNSKEKF